MELNESPWACSLSLTCMSSAATSVVALLVLGGNIEAWQSLLQNILIGLIFGGIVFALIGLALFTVGLVFKVRDWLRRRSADAPREAGTTPIPQVD